MREKWGFLLLAFEGGGMCDVEERWGSKGKKGKKWKSEKN